MRLSTPRFELPPAAFRDIARRTPPPLIGWRTPPPIVQRCAAAYQDVGAVTSGSATDVVWPTHVALDYAILVVIQAKLFSTVDPGAATLSTAAGFTAVSGGSRLSTSSNVVRLTLFEKRASGSSESAPQVADVSGYTTAAYIITFRNCATSGSAVDVVSTAANDATETAVTIGGATTTVADSVVFVALGAFGNSGTTVGSWANSDLASFTERIDSAPAARTHLSGATGDKTTAGAYGNTTATLSLINTWAGITVALKPVTATNANLLLLGVG